MSIREIHALLYWNSRSRTTSSSHDVPLQSSLIDLLMRKPLAGLQVLLLERRIQHTQPPYLARARGVVALNVGFGFAVCGLEGEGACSLESH